MSLFFNVMKNNFYATEKADLPIEKIVLTVCLKVAKNSIFTGVNNLYVNTILSENADYAQTLSHVRLSATPWTVARQAPLSMRFPRQEY